MIPKIKVYKNKFANPKFSYISIVVLVGSVFEEDGKKGISHFIEHLIFKGSEYNENIKILNNKLNSMGMVVNAYTTNFLTNFYINTPTEYINNAIEALVQIVFNPLFREEDIEKERLVVINEILQKSNAPDNLANIYAQKKMYTSKNPLNHPVIGYIDDLKSLKRDDIEEYYKKYYQPKNIIFFTSTNERESKISKLWLKAYNKYGNILRKPIETESTLILFKEMKPKLSLIGKPGLYYLTKFFPNNQTYFVLINFILKDYTKKELFALDILSNYLAGSLSSVLFLELREEKQLIYSVSSNVDIGIDNVCLSIEFNCRKNRSVLRECFITIDKVLRDFYKNGISESDFKKFKYKTLVNYHKYKENGTYKINTFLDKYFYGISLYNYEGILKKINRSYFHNAITKILKDKNEFVFIA